MNGVETSYLFDQANVSGLEIDSDFKFVLFDEFKQLFLAEFVRLEDSGCISIPLSQNCISIKLLQQRVNFKFALTTLRMVGPVLHQDFFDLLVIFLELILNLFSPDYRTCLHGDVSNIADFDVFSVNIRLFEFLIKKSDTFFNSLKELTLIFLNS